MENLGLLFGRNVLGCIWWKMGLFGEFSLSEGFFL
jgi:hypothetical protein